MNVVRWPTALLLGLVLGGAGCPESIRRPPIQNPGATNREILRLYESYRDDFPEVRGVTPEDLIKLRAQEDVLLVDVREASERAVSVIPGAITREQFESEKSSIGDRPIVAYCTIGYRSGEYVEKLNKEGIPALNLEGSILAWVNAGQPIVDSHGAATKRVHTYGAQWSLLPEGYEAVY